MCVICRDVVVVLGAEMVWGYVFLQGGCLRLRLMQGCVHACMYVCVCMFWHLLFSPCVPCYFSLTQV